MMRLARRASLLVAFYLLTSAATVYAECAWVLWEDYSVSGVDWTREGAFADRESCVKEARNIMAKMPHVKFEDLPAGLTWWSGHGYAKRQCWPDTVDPRGPKEK
jgi:hypothetical protein